MLAESPTIATLIILLVAFAIPVQPLAQEQENETSLLSSTAPIPLIYQPLVPDAIRLGTAGFTLTVNGTGFVSGSRVTWNGSGRATTFVGKSQLKVGILATDIAKPSTARVTVINPGPGGGTSNVVFFDITVPTVSIILSSALQFGTGSGPGSVATGDLNGDGKLDLVVANLNGGSVSVLLGNGDGTFQSAASYDTGAAPNSVAVGVSKTH